MSPIRRGRLPFRMCRKAPAVPAGLRLAEFPHRKSALFFAQN